MRADRKMYTVTIAKGKEAILLKHNPWVFSGAIGKTSPAFTDAGLATVVSEAGLFIAYGWLDMKSHTVLHLLSWDENVIPDDEWLKKTIAKAVEARKGMVGEDTSAIRLVHGEADFIPGLVVDRYEREARVIISSRYAADHLETIWKTLFDVCDIEHVFISVDRTHAGLEGLRSFTRSIDRNGNEVTPVDQVLFRESGIWYAIDSGIGQKSGFYCDQRDNRNIIERYARGKKVLDVCSFTGAFTLHCLRGGAESVLAVDSSETVLRHLLYQIHLNEDRESLPPSSRDRVATMKADVFTFLRQLEEGQADMIILDPPKLAPSRSHIKEAMKGYKDINRLAMEKIAAGGIVASFSCSGSVSREDFRMAIAWAAADAHVDIQILEQLSAGADHPVRLSLPETEYLKGFVYRVVK